MGMRPLKFKLKDTTLTSDVNQTLSNLLSQTNKTNKKVTVVEGVANEALSTANNPSLSLEDLTDVTITNPSAGQGVVRNPGNTGWINGKVGVPAGSVVWAGGYSGWITANPAAFSAGNESTFSMLPGRLASCLPASWAVTLAAFSGATVIVDACAIAVCAADSLTVIETVPVTFNGGSVGATYTTEVTTDPINIQIDADHDYYLIVFYDNTSGNSQIWQQNIWADASFGAYKSGNQTAVTAIPSTGINLVSYVFYKKIVSL
jgi:hypothetical protein